MTKKQRVSRVYVTYEVHASDRHKMRNVWVYTHNRKSARFLARLRGVLTTHRMYWGQKLGSQNKLRDAVQVGPWVSVKDFQL